ncbi:MAG: hypothetical protein ACE5JD_05135 [Candidatus Methylomirabilia bacterium]
MSRWILGLGSLFLCFLGGAPLSAASFSLTPEQVKEAIRVGQRSIVSEEFGAEWTVVNANDEWLMVMTPFHRLALAARKAAFKDEPLGERDVEEVLDAQKGRLALWANLHGGRADFARWYQPVLLSGGQEIKPSFVQNERTALRLGGGSYLARCLYSFPNDGLRPRGRMTLLVRGPDGEAVARFTVDLSTMR